VLQLTPVAAIPTAAARTKRSLMVDAFMDDWVGWRLFAALGFRRCGVVILCDGCFDGFPSLACAFLNAPEQLVLLAVDELQIVICKARPFLFELAFDDVPVAFDF